MCEVAGSQLRWAGGRVVGVDLAAVLALGEAVGIPRAVTARLAPFVEAGLVAGAAKQGQGKGE